MWSKDSHGQSDLLVKAAPRAPWWYLSQSWVTISQSTQMLSQCGETRAPCYFLVTFKQVLCSHLVTRRLEWTCWLLWHYGLIWPWYLTSSVTPSERTTSAHTAIIVLLGAMVLFTHMWSAEWDDMSGGDISTLIFSQCQWVGAVHILGILWIQFHFELNWNRDLSNNV